MQSGFGGSALDGRSHSKPNHPNAIQHTTPATRSTFILKFMDVVARPRDGKVLIQDLGLVSMKVMGLGLEQNLHPLICIVPTIEAESGILH
jgi:hypothetical protein